MQTKIIWMRILNYIEERTAQFLFETWFEETKLISLNEESAIVEVPTFAHKKQLNEKYREIIEEAFNFVTSTNIEIVFLTRENIESMDNNVEVIEEPKGAPRQSYHEANLNKNYIFENYLVGDSNKIAHACAVAVAENPGVTYNPFYVYGNSGLGKTHLIQSIGNYVIQNKNKRVLYVSSQKFKEEFIESLKNSANDIDAFKQKYRDVDVLIVDDIQFLSKTEKTQEEFFHTFNVLHDANKQIVISSDKAPQELHELEERLKTRFSWGVTVDITPPDLDLRVKILKKKILSENIDIYIPDEIIGYIASQFKSDVRELEGALRLLLANAAIMGGQKEIDLEFTVKALRTNVSNKKSGTDMINRIISIVSSYYNLTIYDLKGKSRKYQIQLPRQIAMYLCRHLTEESFESIGNAFGGRHHSTVMNSCNNIEKSLKTDAIMIKTIEDLKLNLK